MSKLFALIVLGVLLLAAVTGYAQDKPVIVVHAFTTASNVAWPYDMKQMQTQTLAELKAKLSSRYEIVADPPTTTQKVYTLDGEVTGWRSGNAAKRLLVGMGSGRESADLHFWVTDFSGKMLLERKDTIRAEFWGNAYAGSVGQLAHPFADKIAGRIEDAHLE
jgi:hypothetical protein